jgi:hypothetical protein
VNDILHSCAADTTLSEVNHFKINVLHEGHNGILAKLLNWDNFFM